jgi:endonuclease/exonuclease/phosphatase family metal-dependent hydrolase
MAKGGIIRKIIVAANILLALGLLFCYASVYINPARFWIPAIVGLFYPFFLLANLAFLIYWIIVWKKELVISLLAILLGINHLSAFVQLRLSNQQELAVPAIRLISYNVNLFRLYPWSKKPPSHNEVISYIGSNNFDIACLQEFYTVNSKFSEADAKRKLGMRAKVGYIIQNSQSAYGLAIFSRFPIVNSGEIKFENTLNSSIYADVKINGDTVRIYNLHLQSLRLKEHNFNFLLNNSLRQGNDRYDEIKDLTSRLRTAFVKRAQQVALVKQHIASCHYPVILCGDFNDTPVSYTYRELTSKLQDSFKEAGAGMLNTYAGILPSYRIDYILHSPEFKTLNFSSPRLNLSDHYPVCANFTLTH